MEIVFPSVAKSSLLSVTNDCTDHSASGAGFGAFLKNCFGLRRLSLVTFWISVKENGSIQKLDIFTALFANNWIYFPSGFCCRKIRSVWLCAVASSFVGYSLLIPLGMVSE